MVLNIHTFQSDEPPTSEEVRSLILPMPESPTLGFDEFVNQLSENLANWLEDEKCIEFSTLVLQAQNPTYGKAFLKQFFKRSFAPSDVETINRVFSTLEHLHPEVELALIEGTIIHESYTTLTARDIPKSKLVKLDEMFYSTCLKIDRSIVEKYESLSEVEKLLFARIVVSRKEHMSNIYEILLARDDIPQVRGIVHQKWKSEDNYKTLDDCFVNAMQSNLHQLLASN